MFITSFLHFLVIFGELQTDFCENLTEFYQISLKILVYQISVQSLWQKLYAHIIYQTILTKLFLFSHVCIFGLQSFTSKKIIGPRLNP